MIGLAIIIVGICVMFGLFSYSYYLYRENRNDPMLGVYLPIAVFGGLGLIFTGVKLES